MVEVLDHLELVLVARLGDVAQAGEHLGVGADAHVVDDALLLPGAVDAHHHLVLVDAVLHLVALQLVGVLHEVEHVVVGHAALLDVLAGRIQAGVGGGGQARRLVASRQNLNIFDLIKIVYGYLCFEYLLDL